MNVFFRFLFLLTVCVAISAETFARQLQISKELEWKQELEPLIVNGETFMYTPSFKDAIFKPEQPELPVFKYRTETGAFGDVHVSLRNVEYKRFEGDASNFIDLLESEPITKAHTGRARNRSVLTFSMIPMRQNPSTGAVEVVTSFTADFQIQAATTRRSSGHQWASNSVLASGEWYKIAVKETGIHRIDYDFLSEIGIDVDQIDPRNIRIYGNGGGMLPELNAEERIDDLEENPIYIYGEGNGSFDQGNYILFFGESPNEVYFDESAGLFRHQMHLYDTKTYYFLTVGSSPGKRVPTAKSATNPNHVTSTFSDYIYHEVDMANLNKSGRQWYGESFGFATSSRTFSFQTPGIVNTHPATIEAAVAARSTSNQSAFTFNVNGQQVLNLSGIGSVGTSYTSDYARREDSLIEFQASGNSLNVTIQFQNAASAAQGWLDYFGINLRRNLNLQNNQLIFSDIEAFEPGRVTEFRVAGMQSGYLVWDITSPFSITSIEGELNGGEFRFNADTGNELKRFIAFNPNTQFSAPEFIEKVENQNLHAIQQADMIIVYHPVTRNAAEELANHHTNTKDLKVATVNVKQIYNEFSSGAADISAIRDFTRMLYDRNSGNPQLQPRYLLLFGNGSYDNRNILNYNNNLIPTFQTFNSLSQIGSYVTDDFFGFLEDHEGGMVSSDLLDIAVGRLPARNAQHASQMVAKIKHYESTASFGSWRNDLAFIADDGDNNLHIGDTEILANFVKGNYPQYNLNKIYFDAYPRVSTPGGARFPDAQQSFNNQIFRGALFVNYLGHGGVNGWAHERVLTISDILSWDNFDKMPLFITATCEFSRFDDPSNISAGEHVILNPNGGGIALVTTVRLVFANANRQLNQAFLDHVFEPVDGEMPTLGEVLMNAKNFGSAPVDNSRKFVLLGDPAMRLAYPEYRVQTTKITEVIPDVETDTLKALGKYTVEGVVLDLNGNIKENFNGIVYPRVFDKNVVASTLGQASGSHKKEFNIRKNVIYNGQASVKNGRFEFTFIVPKDIMFKFGPGKISYYADNSYIDAGGYDLDVMVGGTTNFFVEDNQGPEVDVYMNDESFVFGGLTDPNPVLLVKLRDESGINTVGSGIGHDLTAVLNDDTRNVFVLNDFYESDLDDFRKGTIEYPLSSIEEGRHAIRVKAWDVHNNSGEGYTEFVVAESAELALSHVFNYPNPFTTSTNFMFEHNQPGQVLDVQVQIFTVAGRLVKTIQQEVMSNGYRIDNIHWDGLDDFGDKIGRGVYVYKINVRSSTGLSAHKFEKLVILR